MFVNLGKIVQIMLEEDLAFRLVIHHFSFTFVSNVLLCNFPLVV